MNKKGFTLIELLAVIVILSVVMLLGTVSIAGVRNKMNKSMFEAKIDLVLGTAKSWGQDNKESLTNTSVSCYRSSNNSTSTTTLTSKKITINELITLGDLQTEETVPQSQYDCGETTCPAVINTFNGKVANDMTIAIYKKNNRVYACVEATTNNFDILGENTSTYEEYKDSNFYCSC
ncbi:MAG: type II secretion system protein [Firmicutes bacterium]|nr:type II secretion system protein [Bacillota bacterium]